MRMGPMTASAPSNVGFHYWLHPTQSLLFVPGGQIPCMGSNGNFAARPFFNGNVFVGILKRPTCLMILSLCKRTLV